MTGRGTSSHASITNPYDPRLHLDPYRQAVEHHTCPDSIKQDPYGGGNPYSNNPVYVVPSR